MYRIILTIGFRGSSYVRICDGIGFCFTPENSEEAVDVGVQIEDERRVQGRTIGLNKILSEKNEEEEWVRV